MISGLGHKTHKLPVVREPGSVWQNDVRRSFRDLHSAVDEVVREVRAIPAPAATRPAATISANVTTSGTGDNLLLTCRIPGASAVAGSTYRVTVRGASAASGNPTWSVKVGGTGTVADTTAWTVTMTSGTTAGGGFDVLVTVKTPGLSGSVAAAGQGQMLTSVTSSATITPQAVNTSEDWYITAVAAMSSSTFTAVSGTISQV